jgi:hypothetical protein
MNTVRKCNLPPPGWYCTREAGHEGPCAAMPMYTPEENKRADRELTIMFILAGGIPWTVGMVALLAALVIGLYHLSRIVMNWW